MAANYGVEEDDLTVEVHQLNWIIARKIGHWAVYLPPDNNIVCPHGYVLEKSDCFPCPPGQFRSKNKKNVSPVPRIIIVIILDPINVWLVQQDDLQTLEPLHGMHVNMHIWCYKIKGHNIF
ncbi:uncharacterized protein LOC143223933 [Tachypleus tridentatus]|uniref:uncharacterized protein LOC143223933 n=1 Tax=Tachypleus tridentatus TaxID=6853 RepID=UPI003FD440CE